MSIITKIEVQKRRKDKVNLFLDEVFRCSLTAESVVRARLAVGQELTEEDLQEILLTSESEIAFNKACDYLSRAMKTGKEMRTYLTGKGFDGAVVDNVLEKLSSYRYIDDQLYASSYLKQSLADKGAVRIKQEMSQKGIEKHLIENVLAEVDKSDYEESAYKIAAKYMRNKDTTQENLVRLQRYLLSRGYEYDTVYAVLRKFRAQLDD